jgi:hypothetical protein
MRLMLNVMKKRINATQTTGWEVDVIRSFKDIERIRSVWEEMLHEQSSTLQNPNADINGYLSFFKPLKDTVQPYIILSRSNGHPKAMLIGRNENTNISCRVGYLTLFSPSLRCLSIVNGGILGQPDVETCSILIEELNRSLRNGEADVVIFNHLSTDSEMYKVATSASFFCCNHFPVIEKHWKALLRSSYEEFYRSRSKNTRHNICRYSGRVINKYGSRLSIKCFTKADEIDQLFNDTVKVAEKTYQYGLGCSFVDDIKIRNLINHSIARKWLKAYVLYIDGRPRAFWHGIHYGKTFFTFSTGYDPAYHNDRLGLFLLVKVFEDLCRNHSVDTVDFGFGDAQYKESFCDVSWMEASVYIFAPRFYPMLVNTLHSSITGLSIGMSSLFRKVGFERWVKRRWRNLLQTNNPKVEI